MAQYTAVRYGKMRHVGGFLSTEENLRKDSQVVLHTDRGVEMGVLLRNFNGDIPAELNVPMVGELLRSATLHDLRKFRKLVDEVEPLAFKYAHRKIRELGLEMKLSKIEHLFGGEKIIFYFLAENRVDFRELVRDLAQHFRTRIEMRQVGVRDETRLVGNCEMCGQTLCCQNHLTELQPVNMKMAKNQMKTLDPTRISGRCGRLRCCLRYEDEVYNMLKKEMPNIGQSVEFSDKMWTVSDRIPLRAEVALRSGEVREKAPLAQIRVLTEDEAKNYDANKKAREEAARAQELQERQEAERRTRAERQQQQQDRGRRDPQHPPRENRDNRDSRDRRDSNRERESRPVNRERGEGAPKPEGQQGQRDEKGGEGKPGGRRNRRRGGRRSRHRGGPREGGAHKEGGAGQETQKPS